VLYIVYTLRVKVYGLGLSACFNIYYTYYIYIYIYIKLGLGFSTINSILKVRV
jgi:hypothetical protein